MAINKIKKIVKGNATKVFFLFRHLTLQATSKPVNLYNYICSAFSNKALIHVIGDSHVFIFRNKKAFVPHHVGPATMYNLNKEDSSTKSNLKLFKAITKINKSRDIVMLVFGEIDCRIHIYYQFEKQNKKFTIPELISRTIVNYSQVLEKLRAMDVRFCVYGIPATGTQANHYGYAFYGTPQIRNYICKEFNRQLKEFCEKNRYAYIDIYPRVSDENGFVRSEFSADQVHLNGRIFGFVKQEINKILNGVSK